MKTKRIKTNRKALKGGNPVKRIALTTCLLAATLCGYAQCEVPNEGFGSEEVVHYDLLFNWKFVWTKAGNATLTFGDTIYNSTPAYRINLLTVGNRRADFFFKLRDTLTSIVSERLEPLYYRKAATEGKRYWIDEAMYSYKDGVSHVSQIRTQEDGSIQSSEDSDSRCIYDMLSVLAWARYLNMDNRKDGERIQLPIATGKRVEEQTLIFCGRQKYKAENNKVYNSLLFSLVKKTKDGKEKEVLTFYISDDRNRLPIRLDLFLNFGSARASMVDATGNRYPFTSIVK